MKNEASKKFTLLPHILSEILCDHVRGQKHVQVRNHKSYKEWFFGELSNYLIKPSNRKLCSTKGCWASNPCGEHLQSEYILGLAKFDRGNSRYGH
jgi:hypothetical protein